MKMKRTILIGACLAGAFAAASAHAARPDYWTPNYNKSKIAPYTLEDPLTFVDGTKVATPADWARRRREILGIFAREMFGEEPPAPEAVVVEKVEEGVTLAGFGIRTLKNVTCGETTAERIVVVNAKNVTMDGVPLPSRPGKAPVR